MDWELLWPISIKRSPVAESPELPPSSDAAPTRLSLGLQAEARQMTVDSWPSRLLLFDQDSGLAGRLVSERI
jgi:hypothetical protein